MKDITNDDELVEVLDELMHRLKPLDTGLGILFKAHMNDFIQTYKLDGDPHAFVSLETWRARREENAREAVALMDREIFDAIEAYEATLTGGKKP